MVSVKPASFFGEKGLAGHFLFHLTTPEIFKNHLLSDVLSQFALPTLVKAEISFSVTSFRRF